MSKIYATPGCVKEASWSKARNRMTALCEDHLELHRRTCKLSNVKKNATITQLKYKANNYDQLHKENLELQKELIKYKELYRHAVKQK